MLNIFNAQTYLSNINIMYTIEIDKFKFMTEKKKDLCLLFDAIITLHAL